MPPTTERVASFRPSGRPRISASIKNPSSEGGAVQVTEDERDEKIRRLRRRRAASQAAYRMHEIYPQLASENGRKGGLARVAQVADPSAYGRWLARRRWYGELAGPPPPTRKSRQFQAADSSAIPMTGDHDAESHVRER